MEGGAARVEREAEASSKRVCRACRGFAKVCVVVDGDKFD